MSVVVPVQWRGPITAAAYIAAAHLGLLLATQAGTVSVIWPPTGIALAACLVWGWRMAPWVFVAATVANIWNALNHGTALSESCINSVLIGIGNAGGPLAGAAILQRAGFSRSFQRQSDLWHLLSAAVVGSAITACGGATILNWTRGLPFAPVYAGWMLGDALGVIVVAPALLITGTPLLTLGRLWLPGAACVLAAWLIGYDPFGLHRFGHTVYLVLVPVVWLGIQGGPRAAAAGYLFVSFVLVLATNAGYGPMNTAGFSSPITALSIFLILSGILAQIIVVYSQHWRVMLAQAKARAAADARFRILFEQSSEAHLLFDQSGITDCNAAAIRLLRCKNKQEVLGIHPAALSPEFQPDGRRSLEKSVEMDATARAQGVHRFEWMHRRSDGSEVPVEVTLNPVQVGDSSALLVVWHDLTESKRAAEIEHRARIEAESGLRVKTEFLSTMSHELRTPLTGVVGMAQLLKESELGTDQREQVDIILTCADHLLVLLNDVLDLSRLEAGALPLELEPVDLRRMMHDVTGMVSPMVQTKRLTLAQRVDPTVPRLVRTDEARLRQILLNLVGNAVKFTAQGEVAITLEWIAGDMVWRVRDTGIGIPEAVLPQLFQPFSQGDASMSRRYGGAGLGLAISQRLAQRLGGAITVTSTVSVGTSFVCRIPAEITE